MRTLTAFSAVFLFTTQAASLLAAQERVPGERWMRYADPAEAGFDTRALEAAQRSWEALPSSAFFVVADGAVVVSWGDVERRFMCHSVRKSLLSALFGIYWDRGEIELNKTLADLGFDDEPEPLLEVEKRARILDLLKARSGVFHPAAYAGRTDSRPRGSEGPGRYFAYNNWDFNTLAAILEHETGADVFEAFDEHFGRPLGMQDWRTSDGYYHYELDKSKYPAYPFRLSARDAARIGLLFAREGTWGEDRILSRNWVRRSTALYSIDSNVMGYGFMWWVFREPRFEPHGMVSALGVGNQMIAALPDSDIVVVNRANTYQGEGTPMAPLLDLIEDVLAARTGERVAEPTLVPLDDAPIDPRLTSVPDELLRELVGVWPLSILGGERVDAETLAVVPVDGHVVCTFPRSGTFALYLQPDGTLHQEDSQSTYYVLRDAEGEVTGIGDSSDVVVGALAAACDGDQQRAEELLGRLHDGPGGTDTADSAIQLARILIDALTGDFDEGVSAARSLTRRDAAANVENRINGYGYEFLQGNQPERALRFFELNTAIFPAAFNAWDSLAETHMVLGNRDEALIYYQISLDLNERNDNARAQIERLSAAAEQ